MEHTILASFVLLFTYDQEIVALKFSNHSFPPYAHVGDKMNSLKTIEILKYSIQICAIVLQIYNMTKVIAIKII